MSLLGGVRRLPGGRVRVRLSTRERRLLASLPDQLRPLLAGERDLDTPSGRTSARLFPSAYEDPMEELEYRQLTGDDISRERLAAVEDFARTLEGGTAKRGSWSTELTSDEAASWLSALNDARLTLAMVVGISDDEQWQRGPDRSDPTSVTLYYLGWLQEELLAALMGELEEEPPAGGTP